MVDRSEIGRLHEERLARRTRWLAWAESLVILALLVWVSIEYQNNQYLQMWLESVIGPFGFLLNGTLAGLCAGAFIGYAIAVYTRGKSEEEKILESLTGKKKLVD